MHLGACGFGAIGFADFDESEPERARAPSLDDNFAVYAAERTEQLDKLRAGCCIR